MLLMLTLLPKSSSEDSAKCLITSPWGFTSGEASPAPHPPWPWAFEMEVRENIVTGLVPGGVTNTRHQLSHVVLTTLWERYSCFAPLRNRKVRLRESQSRLSITRQAGAGQDPATVDSDPDIYSSGVSRKGKIRSQIVSRLRQHPSLPHHWGNESPDWWLCKDAHFWGQS